MSAESKRVKNELESFACLGCQHIDVRSTNQGQVESFRCTNGRLSERFRNVTFSAPISLRSMFKKTGQGSEINRMANEQRTCLEPRASEIQISGSRGLHRIWVDDHS
jgi:hypothetical protein